MPKSPVKGTKQVLLELPEQLVAEFKAFAAGRGRSMKNEVIDAMRRHMAYPSAVSPPPPPPPELPPAPLPDSTAAGPPKKSKKGKKS